MGEPRRTIAAAASVLLLAGCAPGSEAPDTGDDAGGVVAERWWTNGSDEIGSAIGEEDAADADDRLAPDEDRYCAMLGDTVDAGEPLLPVDVDPHDEDYILVLRTFLAETRALAPAEVGDAWGDVQTIVEVLMDAGDETGSVALPSGAEPADVERSVEAIEEHAASACGLTMR
ncbi:hypothetical protein [Microbacterium karelineae]|uniref:hypothetical protein n=1 Tax=Microbacterium karelineae TaxID=2654283 RepID=UPI0012EAED5D|nr:hypothetical protein [Microbacterium karelineae]